jgi:hypothetical protein
MEKLLKKCHAGIISQLHSIQEVETPSVNPNIQYILSQHHIVFQTPQGLRPSCIDHDYSILLVLGILLPNVHHYGHPFSQKNEIEKIVQEFLEVDVIHVRAPILPLMSWSSRRKEIGACVLIFRALKKLTIKDKFPIHFIDDLLDELSGAQYFAKLNLHSGYHQICMKEEDRPKTSFLSHMGHYEFLVIPFGLRNSP